MSRSFISELRRRRVFRTAGLYLIGAWLVIQVASETLGPIGLPDWSVNFVVWAAIIGFPFVLVLGWRYEIGPDGIVKTAVSDAEPIDLSLNSSDYVIIGFVTVIVGIAAFGLVRTSTEPAGLPPSLQLSGEDLRTVAVLPFNAEGSGPPEQDLIDGFVEELRRQLNDVPGIRTAGRISSNAFRNRPLDPSVIAAQLRVQIIVVGSFRRDGDELCAVIDLIEGSTGLMLQSDSDELCAANIAALQHTAATRIAQALLPDAASVAESVARSTLVETAQEARLLADAIYNRVRDDPLVDPAALDRAIDLYRQAVEYDSTAAIAHTRLASALLYRGDVDEALESLFAAQSKDPRLPELYATLGDYYYKLGNDLAGPSWREALELNENQTDALEAYGQWLWNNDATAAAEQYFRRAILIEPLMLRPYSVLGDYLGLTGRPEEALEIADDVLERFPNGRGYFAIARINEVAGRLDHAIAWARRAEPLLPEQEDGNGYIAELYARIGNFDKAHFYEPNAGIGQLLLQRRYDELIDEAQEQMIMSDSVELNVRYSLAFAYNATGEPGNAVYILEQAGLPESIQGETRESISVQAAVHLIGGLYEIDRKEEATAVAATYLERTQRYVDSGASGWWPDAYQACALAGVRRDEEALERLERLPDASGLVLYPLLRDSICFSHLQDDPRYLEVVKRIDARMAAYRERLPVTLREYGIEP